MPMYTRPTGLSALPPPGPAIPVTDTADFIVENNGNADEAAAKIAEEVR